MVSFLGALPYSLSPGSHRVPAMLWTAWERPTRKNQCLSRELSVTAGTESSMTAWKHNSNTLGERRCPHPGPASSSQSDEDRQPEVLANAQARFLPDHSHCEAVGYRVRGTTYFYLVAEPGNGQAEICMRWLLWRPATCVPGRASSPDSGTFKDNLPATILGEINSCVGHLVKA